jgi:hypothetical protein
MLARQAEVPICGDAIQSAASLFGAAFMTTGGLISYGPPSGAIAKIEWVVTWT